MKQRSAGKSAFIARLGRGVLCAASIFAACAGICVAGEPSKAAPAVNEDDLQRVARIPSDMFPWKKNAPPAPTVDPAKKKVPAPDTGALPDMTAGDIIIKAAGDFSREVKKSDGPGGADKEVLTLTHDVEIEQLQTQSVLRGQKIKVIRDLKTGQTELLEASGGVEVVTPERKGRGEILSYETKFGPQGQILKDLYTIEGNRVTGAKAVLWQGQDVIEAEKFVSDRRLDLFRVLGGPTAIVTIPSDPGAPQKAAPAVSAGGMLPGFGFSGGNKIRLRADGEMFYEGSVGRVHITRNVIIQQDGADGQVAMQMMADDAVLTLVLPPPGQPQENNSVFTGSLKTLECSGRVEIRAPAQTVICDRGVLDMQRKTLVMEMKSPKDDVRIFIRETAAGGKVLIAPKRLTYNTQTGVIEAAGPQRMETFTGTPPSNRK